MVFKLFKKKERFGLPEKGEIDIPPTPPLMQEEYPELPTFPTFEEEKTEGAGEKKDLTISAVDEMERQAIRGVEGELGEREELKLTKPIFVEARLYKAVMDDVGVLRNVLKDSADMLQTMSDLKDDKEKNYGVWHKQIEDIQRKLIYADNSLFGKKSRS